MIIPAAAKTSMGLVLVGTGIGAGLGKVATLKAFQPHDPFESSGYSRSVPVGRMFKTKPMSDVMGLKEDTATSSTDKTKFDNTFGCFSNSFPGAQFKHDMTHDTNVTIEKRHTEEIALPDDRGSQTPVGCMLMQMSYDSKSQWSFKSEMTVRNEKVGLAFWTVGNGRETSVEDRQQHKQEMQYRVAFMEYKYGTWTVVGGYQWQDNTITGNALNIKVVAPNANVLVNLGNGEAKSNETKLTQYSGIWEVNGRDGNDGVFGAASIYFNGNTETELFGRKDSFEGSSFAGFTSVRQEYNTSSQQWETYTLKIDDKEQKGGEDISMTLDKWYGVFREAKGTWHEADKYWENYDKLRAKK